MPHHLLELGLNRGQTIKDLLTSSGTDRNLIKPLLRTALGGAPFVASQWCVQGFEANPVFTAQLQMLEASLEARAACASGWRAKYIFCVKIGVVISGVGSLSPAKLLGAGL